ncbi:MAG: hypothetical protein RRZ67_04605 [Victivallaceae bacterium]
MGCCSVGYREVFNVFKDNHESTYVSYVSGDIKARFCSLLLVTTPFLAQFLGIMTIKEGIVEIIRKGEIAAGWANILEGILLFLHLGVILWLVALAIYLVRKSAGQKQPIAS